MTSPIFRSENWYFCSSEAGMLFSFFSLLDADVFEGTAGRPDWSGIFMPPRPTCAVVPSGIATRSERVSVIEYSCSFSPTGCSEMGGLFLDIVR